MNLFKSIFIIIISGMLIAGCGSNSGSDSESRDDSSKMGTLKLQVDAGSSAVLKSMVYKSGGINKSINLNSIKFYNIAIRGQGISDVNDLNVPAYDLPNKIYLLNAVKNLTIELEILGADKSPLLGGTKISGYGDITSGDLTVITVSWKTTPVARVINRLLDDNFSQLDQFNPSALQASVNTAVSQGKNFNAVDTAMIAGNIKTDLNYSTVNMLQAASVTGTVSPVSAGVIVSINDPAAESVETDASGQFTISNVSPGTWTVYTSESGSRQVTVNSDGTYSPDPVTIGAGVNRPVIYKWGVLTMNSNNVRSALFVVHADDMDGLADIKSVYVSTPSNAAGYQLYDNGSGFFYDTLGADGKYEGIHAGELQDGTYTVKVNDSAYTESQSADCTVSYIDSPVVTYPAADSVIGDRSPLIKWDAVAGASSYLVVIKNGDVVVHSANAWTNQYQVPAAITLPEATYTLYIYAYKNYTTYAGSVSVTSHNFTIQLAAGIDLQIGEVNYVYYSAISGYVNKYNIRTGTVTNLSTGRLMSVSGDGNIALYIKSGALYRMRTNGTGQFKIAERINETITYAKLSPDNSKIVYAVVARIGNTDYSSTKLYIVNSNGSGELLVDSQSSVYTDYFRPYPYSCIFSKDCTKLYYISYSYVKSVNVDGSDSRILDTNQHNIYDFKFDLSSNNRLLIKDSSTSLINTDGSNATVLNNIANARCFTLDNNLIKINSSYSNVDNAHSILLQTIYPEIPRIDSLINFTDASRSSGSVYSKIYVGFDNSIYLIYGFKNIINPGYTRLLKINPVLKSYKDIFPAGSISDWDCDNNGEMFIF